MDFFFDMVFLTDFMASSLRLAVPIAFAALAGVIAERSGVYNVGLEGMILAGAFGAATGAYLSGIASVGLVFGLLLGGLGGLILSILTVSLRVNQLVAGIAINLFFAGLTAFLARQIFGADMGQTSVAGYEPIAIPWLSSLPIIGKSFFNQDPIVYGLYLLVPFIVWFFYKTQLGLNLRATGENPRAADSAGVAVFSMRYMAVTISGMLAAVGGCHLVLSQIHLFTEDMSAGKGYIALAAIILGRWNPLLAVVAALFFGLCDAAQLRLQFEHPDVPYQIFLILPYLVSILALIGLVGAVRAPEALGKPYDRESR
ncbi:MAG: ABC transporter permease [Cellvibrionaceae bacterium]